MVIVTAGCRRMAASNAKGDDDKWVTIACGNEAEWQTFCQSNGEAGIGNR